MPSVVDVVQTIGLPAITGFVVWYVQSRIEAFRRERERLHEQRRAVYLNILEPYIRLLVGMKSPEEAKKANEVILSYDYKRTSFELNMVADDSVVIAFNDLMQHFYALPDSTVPISEADAKAKEEAEARARANTIQTMTLWGNLILEIRKSVGNSKTQLETYDMFAGWAKDIDKYFEKPVR